MFGFGGGMLLIGVLPLFLRPHLIVPIHGVTQLVSNFSRMGFSWQYVHWTVLPKFFLGSLFGALIFSTFLANVALVYVPIFIGVYMILNLWVFKFSRMIARYESFFLIGFIQTGLGLIVGATGPLSMSVLTKKLDCQHQMVATSALLTALSHLFKVIVFGFFGFSFIDNAALIVAMIIGAIVGSYCGTRLRHQINNTKMILWIKLLLTALAFKMIVLSIG